jgi:tetratricopeptide (TPR) repeat protein
MALFLAADLFRDADSDRPRDIPRFALAVADELERRGRNKEGQDLLVAVATSLLGGYEYAETEGILDGIGCRWGTEAAQDVVKRWASQSVDQSALEKYGAWSLCQQLDNLAPLARWAVPELRYQALLQQLGHDAACLEALGTWQLERRHLGEAREVLERALAAGPGKRLAFVLYHLFKANVGLGEKRRAEELVGSLAEAVGKVTLESWQLVAEHQLHLVCIELAEHLVELGRHEDALAFTGAAERLERAHNEDLLDGSPTIVPQQVRGGLWLEGTALHLEALMALERFADASDAFAEIERKPEILAAAHADRAKIVERILGAGIGARLRAASSSTADRAKRSLALVRGIVAEPRVGALLHALACVHACLGEGDKARAYAQRAQRSGIPAATIASDPLLTTCLVS